MGRKGWGWVGNSWRDYFECWGLELGEVRSKLRARRFFMAASSSGSFRRMLSHFSLFMCQAGKNPGWVRQEAARTGSHFTFRETVSSFV